MLKKPSFGKSLAELNPTLSKEWHRTKNGSLTPHDVTEFTHHRAWWICPKGVDHEWQANVSSRSKGVGCPICAGKMIVTSNSLATLRPDLAKEWHSFKNIKTPQEVSIGSGLKVWWKCEKGNDHEWESTVYDRTNGNKCPVCSGKKVVLSNCFATLRPDLAKEWHPSKNKSLTPFDVTVGSSIRVWWKCDKGDDHEWKTSISHRKNGKGCPVCIGQKVVKSNCLATLRPKLSSEWHPTKNGSKTPYDVTVGSSISVWWKCDKGDDHEWKTSIAHRTNGKGCPVCIGQKVVKSNCLATLRPELASEWHPIKNGLKTPYDVGVFTHTKVWWKCKKGDDHEWLASVSNRSNGRGCSICRGLKVVNSNCLATLFPKLANEWHPTKNSKTPFEVTAKSGFKAWWRCIKNNKHEWNALVNDRARGNGCPYCYLTPFSREQLTIAFELSQFFEIDPRGFKTRIDNKLWTIDIYLPELNFGIEYDGYYWHKNKRELDQKKSKVLINAGYKIMRVRDEPLKAITDIDLISKKPFNAKKITNEILKYLISTHSIGHDKMKKIKSYLLKKSIQNEKKIEEYIELVLNEKSKK